MRLLSSDEQYLKEKGLYFEVLPDGTNSCVVIKGLPLAPGKYSRECTDVLVCIPQGYNDATLDNFYVEPELKLSATGQHPEAASHFEEHAGKRWQRFSRHVPIWRPGVDSLRSFMPAVLRELQNRN